MSRSARHHRNSSPHAELTSNLGSVTTEHKRSELGSRGEAWVAGQTILFLAILISGLRGRPWPRGTRMITRVLALSSGAVGFYLMQQGVRSLGKELTPLPVPNESAELKTEGIYSLVRHPIYTGALLLCLGWALFRSPSTITPTLALYFFFVMKSQKEEYWLEEKFPEYAAYRERVPDRMIPGIR
jgi:protein-S-isoprenylcysteine O-methyltransferase Ste14